MNHRQFDHAIGLSRANFVIAIQTREEVESVEGTLVDPSFGRDHEFSRFVALEYHDCTTKHHLCLVEDFLDAGNQSEQGGQYSLSKLSMSEARRYQIDMPTYLHIVANDAACAQQAALGRTQLT
jgi:hypothetical protein